MGRSPKRKAGRTAGTGTAAAWGRAREVLRRHRRRLLARVGVVGVDVGIKIVGAKLTRVPAIRVHVRTKEAGLTGRRLIPERIDGVLTDVIESRAVSSACASDWSWARRDPLVGGVSWGRRDHPNHGTLGACVVDATGAVFGLTCRHVVRLEEDPEPMVQPPESTGLVGREERSVFGALNDAAIVRIGAGRGVSRGLRGNRAIKGVLDPIPDSRLPLPVLVVGGCSGLVEGYVDSTHLSIDVEWDGGVVRVVRHLHLYAEGEPITVGGDSGALIFEPESGRVVGMVRAGDDATFGVGIPIARVLADLRVSFL